MTAVITASVRPAYAEINNAAHEEARHEKNLDAGGGGGRGDGGGGRGRPARARREGGANGGAVSRGAGAPGVPAARAAADRPRRQRAGDREPGDPRGEG